MSVKEIETVAILFPNQEWSTTDPDVKGVVSSQLQPTISFSQQLSRQNIQTLSAHNADERGKIGGFLYVPDLRRTDPCFNTSRQFVPTNVTRQANLPPTDYTLIGVVPWISIACTKSYLSAARLDPVRALLFYLPNNGTSQPPPVKSPLWGLEDGGAWKSETPFPVYAISSDMGTQLMRQSSLYSGNMTSVPNGHEISEMAGGDPRDYVRLHTKIHISKGSGWPGVWAFVLVIVAALALMLILTSATMHLLLRCRRYFLRLRVATGEVNLEALGIARLTVPLDLIQKLPSYTYQCEVGRALSPDLKKECQSTVIERRASSGGSSHVPDASEVLRNPPQLSKTSDAGHSLLLGFSRKHRPDSQPTCAICLDDFVSGSTTVRELPCGHIFHPECIDSFLGSHSSLCPMCKKSVLPIGYCPTRITNSMVRRERNIRALRFRVNSSGQQDELSVAYFPNIYSTLRRTFFQSSSFPRHSRITMPPQPQVVLTTMATPRAINHHDPVLGHELLPEMTRTLSRHEVAQLRINELTSRQTFIEEVEVVNPRERPKWRRSIAKAFPGFS